MSEISEYETMLEFLQVCHCLFPNGYEYKCYVKREMGG